MADFKGIEKVLERPEKFMRKFEISEDPDSSSRKKKRAAKLIIEILNAAAMGQALIGILATVVPGGWIVVVGVVGALGHFGINRYASSDGEDRIDVIPRWINSPLDVFAVVLFEFFAPLGFRVANLDGEVTEDEWKRIKNHFVSEWGYSPEFVQKALPGVECNLANLRVAELVTKLIAYQVGNPNYDYHVLSKELTSFLKEVIRADGELHDLEVIFIQWLEITLARGNPEFWDELHSAVGFGDGAENKSHRDDESRPNPDHNGDVPRSNEQQRGEVGTDNSGNGDGNKAQHSGRSDPVPNKGEEASRGDDVENDRPSEGGAQGALESAGRAVGRTLHWLT